MCLLDLSIIFVWKFRVIFVFSGKSCAIFGCFSLQTAGIFPAQQPKNQMHKALQHQKQAEITVGQILEQNGITFKKITAKATKTEDGSIIINEIEISGCQNGQNAKEVLQKEKIDCKIKVIR